MIDTKKYIQQHDEGGVRSIVLNRPEKANALTAQMLEDIRKAVEGAQYVGVNAIVLRSASNTLFSAGGDIREFSEGPQHLENQGCQLRALMAVMVECPIPIIGVARGRAAGAGVILLSMTDIVIAADDLVFSCPEFAFNMYPFIVQVALESKISAANARQLCLSGAPLAAAGALQLGLVTEVLESSRFDDLAADRLAYYLSKRDALEIARKGRLLMEPPEKFTRKVELLEPLMHENFSRPGVQDTIKSYLSKLSNKVD